MSKSTWRNDPARVMRVSSHDGAFDAYLARPSNPSRPAVVVLHEVFGVNADQRATCDELAAAGYVAACPDLFWRQERDVDLSVRSEADWRTGVALYRAFDVDAGVRDVESAVGAARAQRGVAGGVGVLGFCLGGLLAYLTAARTRVDAAVAFHGGRTEEFLDEAADLDAPLQVHLAGEDEFTPEDARARIVAALTGRPGVEVHVYHGCRHAFSRHDGLHYDDGAARLARARTLDFLARHLG